MDGSTPGLPVHHQLPEFTQTHVYWLGDAIQPSHPLSSPSPPAFNLSQHQGLFQSVSSSHQVAKILEFQLQHQFFQWIFRTDFVWDGLVGSPCSPRDCQESSPTPQFKSICTTVYKMDSQWEFTVWCRDQIQYSVLTQRGGMGWEMGGRFKREGTYIYLWLIHVDVWQKWTQYCKAIILQLKISNFFKNEARTAEATDY